MTPIFIASPCVTKTLELLSVAAGRLKETSHRSGTQVIFKVSSDKAKQTSLSSFQKPEQERGMQTHSDGGKCRIWRVRGTHSEQRDISLKRLLRPAEDWRMPQTRPDRTVVSA